MQPKKASTIYDVAKKAGSDAKKIAARQLTLLDSLGKNLSADEKQLMQTNDSLQKTAARFNALEESVGNRSMSTRNFLMIAVIVFAVLYLLLLPRWITYLGLGATARAVGWDWRPAVHAGHC